MNRFGSDAYKVSTIVAMSMVFAGFVVIFLGWNGAASTGAVAAQLPYVISGGIGGLGLVLAGLSVVYLQSARKDQAVLEERLRAIESAVEHSSPVTSDEHLRAAVAEAEGLYVVGATSYHRADCRLASGREDAEYLSADEAEYRGLNPCRICNP